MKIHPFLATLLGLALVIAGVLIGGSLKQEERKSTYVADARSEAYAPAKERVVTTDSGGKIIVSATGTYSNGIRFAVNQQLAYDRHSFYKNDLVKNDPYEERPNDLVKRLLRLPGVSAVELTVYDLSIDVGDAFDRQVVEAAVISVLRDWLKKPTLYENEVPKPKERPAVEHSSSRYGVNTGTF